MERSRHAIGTVRRVAAGMFRGAGRTVVGVHHRPLPCIGWAGRPGLTEVMLLTEDGVGRQTAYRAVVPATLWRFGQICGSSWILDAIVAEGEPMLVQVARTYFSEVRSADYFD